MSNPNTNLRAALKQLNISNLELANTIGCSPSLVSRCLSGDRTLKAASKEMDVTAEYILSRATAISDIEWLKEQFSAAGLPTDVSTIYRLKQSLIMWIATDGETLRKNLGRTFPGDIAGSSALPTVKERDNSERADGDVKIGVVEIVLALRAILSSLPKGAEIRLFLSNDRLTTVVNADVASLLRDMISINDMRCNMVVCVSGDTKAMSKLLDRYMEPLISGHVRLSVVHGMTQTVTSAMHILVPGGKCILINETIGTNAPPIAVIIRDAAFVAETENNFLSSARYAQPALAIYGDEYTRDVIEILAMEYCSPSGLDVVKDSINPMFMSCKAFDRFLGTRGHAPEEYAWRSAEFARFKAGMNANLQDGVIFREIISLARLNDIAKNGDCRMAGLYFAELGYVDLDREGCIDIINGYIDYLENEPNFSLLILDELGELHGSNCWHIKRDGHISINNWQGKSPVMVYSDQLMLLREFQARYDALWKRGAGALGSRANVISILRDAVGRMEIKRIYKLKEIEQLA